MAYQNERRAVNTHLVLSVVRSIIEQPLPDHPEIAAAKAEIERQLALHKVMITSAIRPRIAVGLSRLIEIVHESWGPTVSASYYTHLALLLLEDMRQNNPDKWGALTGTLNYLIEVAGWDQSPDEIEAGAALGERITNEVLNA